MTPIQASKKVNEKIVFSNVQEKRKKNMNLNLNYDNYFEQLILKESLAREIAQIEFENHLQSPNSYTTQPLALEVTIYQIDLIKTY